LNGGNRDKELEELETISQEVETAAPMHAPPSGDEEAQDIPEMHTEEAPIQGFR